VNSPSRHRGRECARAFVGNLENLQAESGRSFAGGLGLGRFKGAGFRLSN
jgi:hypothetical protein